MAEDHESADQSRFEQHEKKPLIFLVQDPVLTAMRFSVLIHEAHCELNEIFPNAILDAACAEDVRRPELIIVSLTDQASIERIELVRSNPVCSDAPILAVSRGGEAIVARDRLEALGVVGMVDRETSADNLMFRINQIVRFARDKRRWQRARTFARVEVVADGSATEECLLSLSVAGAGIASTRALHPNTDVTVRFMDAPLEKLPPVKGRVARLSDVPGSNPRHRLGIIFYLLTGQARALLEIEVQALLEAGGE